MMVALGEKLWIYGCMMLYMLYACIFMLIIAKENYPFDNDIIVKKAQLDDLKNLMKKP